jgi:hypothetical protein
MFAKDGDRAVGRDASVPSLTNDSQLAANQSASGNEERHLHIFEPFESGSS